MIKKKAGFNDKIQNLIIERSYIINDIMLRHRRIRCAISKHRRSRNLQISKLLFIGRRFTIDQKAKKYIDLDGWTVVRMVDSSSAAILTVVSDSSLRILAMGSSYITGGEW